MGLGGELPVASTLVSEASAPEKRGRIIVLLESFCGLASCGGDFLLCHTVIRLARAALNGATAFYALYLRKSLPESPAHQALPQKKHTRAGGKCLDETVYPTVLLSVVWFCVVFSYYGMFYGCRA